MLRITLAAGLILLVFSCGALVVFYFIERGKTGNTRQQDSFFNLLSEYDSQADIIAGTGREFDNLDRELDRLEKRAITVESWLSILKRRRALAALHTPSAEAYSESIKRAQKAYPLSQQIAAIAAAALIKDTALNRQAEEQLRDLLSLITDPSFNTMRLGLHVLLGDFRNPERASQFMDGFAPDGNEAIAVDLAILKIMRADFRGAAADIQTLLNSPSPPSKNTLRFSAEYYYDFGDLLRSAQVFSQIEDEQAMIRMADALYLSGYTDSARSIWTILAEMPNENSLYNLAVTSEDRDEAASFLERLVNADPESKKDSRQFGLIRYSRLFPYNRAISILESNENLIPSDYPFIDLELTKRHAQTREPGRQVSEAWLLLDRHPENEDLYWWASWVFFFQRYYDEADILFAHAKRLEFEGQWVSVYSAIQLMRQGDLETAESILRSIPAETAGWHIFANLALILESQRSTARALEQYELAVSKSQNPKIASRIQFRVARCYSTLGNASEARRALEYALELDPENITAQLELDRILYQ